MTQMSAAYERLFTCAVACRAQLTLFELESPGCAESLAQWAKYRGLEITDRSHAFSADYPIVEMRGMPIRVLSSSGPGWSISVHMDTRVAPNAADAAPAPRKESEPESCTAMAHAWRTGQRKCICGDKARDGSCAGWRVESRLTGREIASALGRKAAFVDVAPTQLERDSEWTSVFHTISEIEKGRGSGYRSSSVFYDSDGRACPGWYLHRRSPNGLRGAGDIRGPFGDDKGDTSYVDAALRLARGGAVLP